MKTAKKCIAITVSLLLILSSLSFFSMAEGPGGQGGPGGAGGPGGGSEPSYSGATTITDSVNETGTKYTSSSGSENALLASGGESTLKSITVSKTGDASDENSDFYGTNAAVLAYNDATLNLSDATVTTAAGHANAVFAYGSGVINISDSTIKTTGNNSGAVMVTGGGTLTATNVVAETDGKSSAPIRSDRGGGTLTVNGGKYTANGQGSPAVYSTADITVNDASLKSTSAEGVVIEGKNSVTLNNTTLSDNNITLNGNSETYKNIFIYQSMSGDADEGAGSFAAKNSTITTEHGDSFFVTNTTAVIELTGNTITNKDESGALLRIQSGKWGNSGSNGGDVTLSANQQSLEGDVVVDNISTLKMSLKNSSTYSGTINTANTAKSIDLVLDKSSTWTLTGDCYISSLENEAEDNSNINLNGHTLYVNGKAITSTAYSAAQTKTTAKAVQTTTAAVQAQPEESSQSNSKVIVMIIAAAVLAIGGTTTAVIMIKRKKKGALKLSSKSGH